MALDRQKSTQFRNACAAFDITNSDTITFLSNILTQLTTDLAKSDVLRYDQIWPLANLQLIKPDSDLAR
jgi:hypothetical protein